MIKYTKVLIHLKEKQLRFEHSDVKGFILPIFTALIGGFLSVIILDLAFNNLEVLFNNLWVQPNNLFTKIIHAIIILIIFLLFSIFLVLLILGVPVHVFLKDRKESTINLLKIELLKELIKEAKFQAPN